MALGIVTRWVVFRRPRSKDLRLLQLHNRELDGGTDCKFIVVLVKGKGKHRHSKKKKKKKSSGTEAHNFVQRAIYKL
jgi:hypothetical protein